MQILNQVPLIPQDMNNACWFASTMMMYKWKIKDGGRVIDFSKILAIDKLHRQNNGLPWTSMLAYAKAVGMKPKPLMSPTIETLAGWLRQGPLWTDGVPVDWSGRAVGVGHVVVLAGLRDVPNSNGYEVYINDPWPPNAGHTGWRPIGHLVAIMEAGRNPARNVTFMSY